MKTERDYCYFISLAESLQKASNIAVAFIWQEFVWNRRRLAHHRAKRRADAFSCRQTITEPTVQ